MVQWTRHKPVKPVLTMIHITCIYIKLYTLTYIIVRTDIALRPNPLLSLPANVARCRYIPLPYEECAATAALELPTYIILLLWYTCLLSV